VMVPGVAYVNVLDVMAFTCDSGVLRDSVLMLLLCCVMLSINYAVTP
jgi:hypothetical protein